MLLLCVKLISIFFQYSRCPLSRRPNSRLKDADFCVGHQCHEKARCLNVSPKYTCHCEKGFQGDGFNCTGELTRLFHPTTNGETCCFLLKDANECLERGGERGHHCNMNTRCVNVYGSYKCECLPGYVRSDKWNCIEVDECATGQHSCDENSICTNTEGSYNCTCKPGYAADESRCVPVCDPHCLNGGVCVAPNKCECRNG